MARARREDDDDARGERIHSDPQRRFVLLRDDEDGQQVRGGVKARMERFLQANDEEVPEEEGVVDDDDAPPTCEACGRRKSRCACDLRHPPEHLVDGDPATYWDSGITLRANSGAPPVDILLRFPETVLRSCSLGRRGMRQLWA